MPNTAIEAVGLNNWFGEGEAKTHAVKDVSFEAHLGEMLYVVGPSGSGKTTMLSMISGILRPNSGTVKIEGTEIWSMSNDALAEFRLHKIGFVFQDYHLFPRLTTAENVAIPLILQRRDWDGALKEAAADLGVCLGRRAARQVHHPGARRRHRALDSVRGRQLRVIACAVASAARMSGRWRTRSEGRLTGSANIGMATAAMLPSITLNGAVSGLTNSTSRLFPSNGKEWSVGADLTAPLFEGGSLWFKRKAAIEDYRQSMDLYRQTVLAAFEQVADVLRGLDHDAAALLADDKALSTAAEALHLAQVNYDSGIATYLDLLIADIQYRQAKIADLQAIAVRYQDTVALFAALGGGWWSTPAAAAAGTATAAGTAAPAVTPKVN